MIQKTKQKKRVFYNENLWSIVDRNYSGKYDKRRRRKKTMNCANVINNRLKLFITVELNAKYPHGTLKMSHLNH